MRRTRYRELGAVAIGTLLLLTVLVAGLAPLAAQAPSSHASTPVAIGATAPAVRTASSASPHPAQGIVVTATYTATVNPYTLLPYTLSVNVGASGDGIGPGNFSTANATVFLTITDTVTSQFCSAISDNSSVNAGITTYNFVLNPVLLSRTPCNGITNDPVSLNANFTFWGYDLGYNNASANAVANTSLIFAPLSATLVSPNGGVGVGNATFVATYVAQYLSSVRLLIWNPAKTSVLENASLQWASTSVPASVTWYAPAAGLYPYSLTVTTLYGTFVQAGNVTVLQNGGGTVFYNSTVYHNSTILAGLKGPEAGTLLLVVGLIIGMIVALAVASAMRRDQPTAAQPWQGGQQGQTTPAPNTCSVCGKSFGSADELAGHMKAEHGMS